MTLMPSVKLLTRLALALVLTSASAAPLLQDPWEESYANLDATGAHILGCWKFDELPLADASGHGAYLLLQGASLAEQGRFGGGLRRRLSFQKGGVDEFAPVVGRLERIVGVGPVR